MTEQEEVHEILREFDADEFNLAREILNLRKQEIYLEGQNTNLRKRVDELESIARQYEFERLRK